MIHYRPQVYHNLNVPGRSNGLNCSSEALPSHLAQCSHLVWPQLHQVWLVAIATTALYPLCLSLSLPVSHPLPVSLPSLRCQLVMLPGARAPRIPQLREPLSDYRVRP